MTEQEQRLCERVARLHRSGVPSSHIARRLGIPRACVNQAIRITQRKVMSEQQTICKFIMSDYEEEE